MTIKKKKSTSKIEIDLTGPQGNAFYLMAQVKGFCQKTGGNEEDIIKRMKESDYENLVKVFDEEFGSFVTLLR